MPISAIVGRTDIMNEMEKIFFSGTFGGEMLSLAAANATIQKIEKNNVIQSLWDFGAKLTDAIEKLIVKYKLELICKLNGYNPWKILQFSDHKNATQFEIKTFFMQEMLKKGVLILSSHNICYAHQEFDFFKIVNAYEEVLVMLSVYIDKEAELVKHICSPIIQPLFKVR